MKIKRNQIILLIVIITIAGLFYSINRDNYKFTREEVRDSLLRHIETEDEPEMVYIGQMMDQIKIDSKLKSDIYIEADKGDQANKSKLTELIKKI
jgi:hypothetical protein